nr:MAG TPA: hypothetical protein [Bacteriophage sp.]
MQLQIRNILTLQVVLQAKLQDSINSQQILLVTLLV